VLGAEFECASLRSARVADVTYTTTPRAQSVLQLDVLPKPDPVGYPGVGSPRRLVRPCRALARVASVREIEKLHTVGAAMVGRCLGGRLQKFHAYGRRREVLVSVELDRLVAFCDEVAMPRGFQ